MKYSIYIITAIFIISNLYSCDDNKSDEGNTTKKETPKALQDNKLEIGSYSRSSDLTEELYQELVKNSPSLKLLEQDIDEISKKPKDLIDNFSQYDNKSSSYYNSAKAKASSISDSMLKMKITTLIESSNQRYNKETEELNSMLNQIGINSVTIRDYHTVLKIVMTLPIIEKYQKDNKLDTKEFINLINEQKSIIFRTDSLTPKF